MMKAILITTCTKCGNALYGSSMRCRVCNGKNRVTQVPTMCLKCRSEKANYFDKCPTCGNSQITPVIAPSIYLTISPVHEKDGNMHLDESLNIGQELLLKAQQRD